MGLKAGRIEIDDPKFSVPSAAVARTRPAANLLESLPPAAGACALSAAFVCVRPEQPFSVLSQDVASTESGAAEPPPPPIPATAAPQPLAVVVRSHS